MGQEGGGWPGTLLDVAAGVDALAGVREVDASRVVVVGHSAGGHLALWLAARTRLPAGVPGAEPLVRPRAVVAQAGVCDLAAGSHDALGEAQSTRSSAGRRTTCRSATQSLHPPPCCRWECRSSSCTGCRTTSCRRHRAGRTPRRPRRLRRPGGARRAGGDHFDVINPQHTAWQAVVDRLPGCLLDRRTPLLTRYRIFAI